MFGESAKAKKQIKNQANDPTFCLHYLEYSTTSQNSNKFKLEAVLKFSSYLFFQISPFKKFNFFQDLNPRQKYCPVNDPNQLKKSGIPGSISSLQNSRASYFVLSSCQVFLKHSQSRFFYCLPFFSFSEKLVNVGVFVSVQNLPIFSEATPFLLDGYFVSIIFLGGLFF